MREMAQLLLRCLWREMDCSLRQCMENFENQGLCKSSPVDVADLLPSDPFRMDQKVAQDSEFTDFLQDVDSKGHSQVTASRNGEFDGKLGEFDGKENWGNSAGDKFDKLVDDFRGFDGIFLRDADLLPSDPFGMHTATAIWGLTGSFKGFEDIDWSFEKGKYDVNGTAGNGVLFGLNLVCRRRVRFMPNARNDAVDMKPNAGEPHYAMFLALRYLGVKDLLSVEMACRSLNHAVKTDPSLWMDIKVDHPLNNRLTDDLLVSLTSKARGRLKILTLEGCFRITNAGIKRVIEGNRGLVKLSVPNCFRLSIQELLTTFRSFGPLALKQLRIRGLAGATNKQYEQLRVLLGADDQLQSRDHKPLYYNNYQSYPSIDDDRAIDIEKCPRCNEVRLVYDCTAESCQRNEAHAEPCKACVLCITRCINCGCCLTNCDYMETFVLDNLCIDCWNKIFTHQEEVRLQGGLSCLNQPVLCEGPYLFFHS